jgi:predicted nucleotide-binding protein
VAGQVDSKLFGALQKKLGLGRAQLYKRIARVSTTRFFDRQLAAVYLAAEAGLPISQYASPSEIRELRSGSGEATPQDQETAVPRKTVVKSRPPSGRARRKKLPRGGKTVFVVHGRNEKLRRAMFSFLRSIDLEPLEWEKALALTRKGSPYVGEVLDAAFGKAVAIVVLLTPDDEARLREEFLKPGDGVDERKLTGQARANVLFEAGMAFGRRQDQTVLVQVGSIRPFSDVGGRHVIHLSNDSTSRQKLVNRLRIVGCDLDQSGTDWHHEGDFTP